MYESPIELIQKQMQLDLESKIMSAVQEVGISIDKDELVRALKYDRDQYEKGYADAKAEPPKMHWTDKQVVSVKEAGAEELQSARCSNCGRYHTTPYLYNFDEANYCPYCGFKKE
jgi:DNA-directed RNA polymerase subunit RPC12/RpoP